MFARTWHGRIQSVGDLNSECYCHGLNIVNQERETKLETHPSIVEEEVSKMPTGGEREDRKRGEKNTCNEMGSVRLTELPAHAPARTTPHST